MPPRVVVSVVNWNTRSVLHECLEFLYRVTDYENFEVVVVDNGSTDGSVAHVRREFPETDLIQNDRNRGFATANNQAIERARSRSADYVLLLNSDTKIVDPGWLAELVETAEREADIGIVGCRVVQPDGTVHYDKRYFPLSSSTFPTEADRFAYNSFERAAPADRRFEYVDDVVGAVFLIKWDVIDEIGGLDETFSPAYGEESDYCLRAWDAGFTVAYTRDAEVVHLRNETSEQLDEMYLHYVQHRNKLRLWLRHYPAGWLLRNLHRILLSNARFFWSRRSLDRPVAAVAYFLRSYLETAVALPAIVRERRSGTDVKQLLK
jgi:GT2 family glycosyltransferase